MGKKENFRNTIIKQWLNKWNIFLIFLSCGLLGFKTTSVLSANIINQTLLQVTKSSNFLIEEPDLILTEDEQDHWQWQCERKKSNLAWVVNDNIVLQNWLTKFRLAKNLEPLNSRAHRYAGDLAWSLGDRMEALNEMEEAVRLNEFDVFAIRLLGEYYSEMGSHVEAISLYEEAGDICRNELQQANYATLTQQALDWENQLVANNLIHNSLNSSGPIICTQTYAVNLSEILERTNASYSLSDLLPSNINLVDCLKERLTLLVDIGAWTTRDVTDLALLWQWWGYKNEAQAIIFDLAVQDPHLTYQELPINSLQGNDHYQSEDVIIRKLLDLNDDIEIHLGPNRIKNGSFENGLSEWQWFSWNIKSWFPENFYIGGLDDQEPHNGNNALRLQGIKRGLWVDEKKDRPNTFAGFLTFSDDLSSDPNHAYFLSVFYRTRNLSDRSPYIAIFDEDLHRTNLFRLSQTDGNWHQSVIIFSPDESLTQTRIGLIMPARGEILFDDVVFKSILFPTLPEDISIDLPRRWDSLYEY